MPPQTIVPFTGLSDGNKSNWPDRGLRPEDPMIYMTKLASEYAKESGQPGANFVLDRLPDGYALFGKTRAKEPTHVDRYLYGNDRYNFRSVQEFYPHFVRLMKRRSPNDGSLDDCTCKACTKGALRRQSLPGTQTVKLPKPPQQPQPQKRAAASHSLPVANAPAIITKPGQQPNLRAFPTTNGAVRAGGSSTEGPLPPLPLNLGSPSGSLFDGSKKDEEGAEDVYRTLVMKLRDIGSVNEPIVEDESFDWRINRVNVKQLLHDVRVNPHFLPRLGEIVLFVRDLPRHHGIGIDPDTKVFRSFDMNERSPNWPIRWEAGLVTQLPEEPVGVSDLVAETNTEHQVAVLGYRVEPISGVLENDKPWSKRYTYVPLHQLRPFVFYRELLKGLKPVEYHPTIASTLHTMCSLTLIERYHFKGSWPSATVFCKGAYLGSELVMVGDTVRLLPTGDKNPSGITDAMRITSIKCKLIHLDALENPDYDPVHSAGRTFDVCVHFAGMAYTQDPSRSYRTQSPITLDSGVLPSGLADYGDWYPLHDANKRWEVPFTQVAGRLIEAEAAEKWFAVTDPTQKPAASFPAINKATASQDGSTFEKIDINLGIRGLCKARAYSKTHDERIKLTDGKSWFWADTRVEQLDLREVNGTPVVDYLYGQPARDVSAWRRALLMRKKWAGFTTKMTREEEDEYAQAVGRGRGRPKASHNSMLAASAMGAEADPEEEDEESEDDGLEEVPARDPLQEISMNDDQDEDMASDVGEDDADVGTTHGQHGMLLGDSSDNEDTQDLMRRFAKGNASIEVMDVDG